MGILPSHPRFAEVEHLVMMLAILASPQVHRLEMPEPERRALIAEKTAELGRLLDELEPRPDLEEWRDFINGLRIGGDP